MMTFAESRNRQWQDEQLFFCWNQVERNSSIISAFRDCQYTKDTATRVFFDQVFLLQLTWIQGEGQRFQQRLEQKQRFLNALSCICCADLRSPEKKRRKIHIQLCVYVSVFVMYRCVFGNAFSHTHTQQPLHT